MNSTYISRTKLALKKYLKPILNRRLLSESERSWHSIGTPELSHSRVHPGASYSPWLDDVEFNYRFNIVKEHSLVDKYRLFELWRLAQQVANIEGDVLEVGAWRGGSGALLAFAVQGSGKKVYLADTFSGVVKAGVNDTRYTGGEHSDTDSKQVESWLVSLECDAVILKGIFPEETGFLVQERLSFVHIDVDVYQSAKDVVDFVIPRMPIGGVIVFDDYGFSGCEGVTRLVNEMFHSRLFTQIHNLNGHAVLIKIE